MKTIILSNPLKTNKKLGYKTNIKAEWKQFDWKDASIIPIIERPTAAMWYQATKHLSRGVSQ